MSNLSKYMVNDIYKAIDQKFIDRYNEYLGKEKSFKDFYNDVLEDYLSQDLSRDEVREMKNHAKRHLNRTKKRWYENVKNEKESPPDDPSKYKYILKQVEEYKSLYKYNIDVINIDDFDKFMQEQLLKVRNWAFDENLLLTDFQYLCNLYTSSIERAFINDLKYLIINIVMNKYDGIINRVISERPEFVANNPIFGERDKLINNGEICVTNDIRTLINEYEVEDDYIIRTVINENDINQIPKELNLKLSNFQSLDEKDSMLFDYINAHRDKSFIKTRKVTIELGNTAKYLYGSNGKKHRELTEKRALRLHSCSISGIIKKEGKVKDTYFKVNLFDSAIIKTDDENSKRYIEFIYTNTLYNQIIDSKTVKIYKDQIQNFSNSLSFVIIYPLQKDRIECYTDKTDYTKEYDYKYFRRKFRFKSKSKEQNMTIISNSLKELKTNKVIVKDYKKIGDSKFEIEFYPLSEVEIHDFIDNSKVKKIEKAAEESLGS